MRFVDRILVAVYVALAMLPVIAMATGIRGRTLFGVLEPAPRPVPDAKAFIGERFQHDFVAWFEGNLGLKGSSIALDNAVLYHAFGETRYGAFVRLGEDGVIFPHDDINYFNMHAGAAPAPAHVEELADKIATAQRTLRAQGRAFVPVIVPSKATIWRDKIPARWISDIAAPRPADVTTQRMRDALDRRGVIYVDSVAVFARSLVPRQYLFGREARHWAAYGACLVMNEVADRYRDLTGKARPHHDCPLSFEYKPRKVVEWDLWSLLNAKYVRKAVKRMPNVMYSRPARPDPAAPRTLFIGTSFCWALLYDAVDSGGFGPTTYNYYNQVFFAAQDQSRVELHAGSDTWRALTMDEDLYVFDLFEPYFAAPGSYVELFLADFVPALAQPR